MKPGGGRTKGHNFERHCCKLFEAWWGNKFIRVPMSGGWNKNVASGDIISVTADNEVDKAFPFSVECKNQEGWTWDHIFKGIGKVNKWWQQCCDDAKHTNKHPLLVFSGNHKTVFVMFSFAAPVSCPLEIPIFQRPYQRIVTWGGFIKCGVFKLPDPAEQ